MENNPIVIADTAGVIRYWSDGAERAFGHEASDAVGQRLDLIVPAEFQEAHWKGFHRAMAAGATAGQSEPGPIPVRHADGRVAEATGRLGVLCDAQGAAIGAMVVFG